MKDIYYIYFDCSGDVLVGEKSTADNIFITLSNAKFVDANGKERSLKECHVNKNKIAFYYVERKYIEE